MRIVAMIEVVVGIKVDRSVIVVASLIANQKT